MQTASRITVLDHDATCTGWLRSSSQVRVLRRSSENIATDAKTIFVLVGASQLGDVAEFVRAANQQHHLKGLLVHADVDAAWIAQMLDRADLRTIRNLLVHRGGDQPSRILNAWRIGAQNDLIADAVALADRLLVISCAMERLEVPWDELVTVSKVSPKHWGPFEVASDGSYLHWPMPDIHLDLDALRQAVDPGAREAAHCERVRCQEGFGTAVASVRRQANLRQSDIDGVTPRQVGRIEAGDVFPRIATLAKLAVAHKLTTNEYLDALAHEQRRLAG